MPRPRAILLLVACGLLAVTGAVMLGHDSEPSYQGRCLSEWVERCYELQTTEEQQAAAQAIRKIGTNALPYLLRWMAYEPPPWRVKWVNEVPPPLHTYLARPLLRASMTPRAFEILGSEARAAIPSLAQLVNEPRTNLVPHYAANALARIGRDALPSLLAALTNQQATTRAVVAPEIRYLGTNARSAIPALISLLQDTDLAVAWGAAYSLRELGLEPALVVPALTNSLRDPRPKLRCSAAISLRSFSHDALPAVPALLQALSDPDPTVWRAASNALFAIAPQALTNATH
jgi:HEAT repeat protein